MLSVIVYAALLGGLYGFALYVRDVYRAVRRARHGLDARIWPPEIVVIEQDDEDDTPSFGTPKRPDR